MLILLGLTVFLFGFAVHRNEERKVEEIMIAFNDESAPFMTRETVNKLLIVSNENVAGKAKGHVALSVMESRVKAHPIVKNAEVYMMMDGTLAVTIEQRKPIARLHGKTSFYIDEMGEAMPLSQNYAAHVPLVTGVSKEALDEVYILTNFIYNDPFLVKHIIGIARKSTGEYILEARKLDYKIVLGKLEELERRFNNYKAFYQKALKDKSLDQYDKIVLKYEGQVVCERK